MCISSGYSVITSIGFFPQPKRLFSDAPSSGGGAESIGHDTNSKRPSVGGGGGGGSKGPAPPVPTSAAATTDIKLNDNKVRDKPVSYAKGGLLQTRCNLPTKSRQALTSVHNVDVP